MNENPSIFLLWKKNQDQDGPDYKVVLWVGRWHIWQNHCVILLLTCLLHSLFLSDTVYCECSNKLLLRELVKKGKKRFISHIFDFGMKIQSEFPVYFCLSTIWCLISDDPMVAEMVPFYLADNTFIHFIFLHYCKPIISSAFPCQAMVHHVDVESEAKQSKVFSQIIGSIVCSTH